MYHSFDVDIASKYGIPESIFLCNIAFWVKQNTLNKHNFFEGRYWSYNSLSAYAGLFPYVSKSTIQRVIKHLKDEGLILTANFNNDKFNHTNYYALTEKGLSLFQNSTVRLGQNESIENTNLDVSIFNNNTDNTDINISDSNLQIPSVIPQEVSELDSMFEKFWEAYPQCFRKANKKGCRAKFLKIKNLKELFPTIMSSLEVQKKSKQWNDQDGQFIPAPLTWINQERWTVTDTRTERQIAADNILKEKIEDYFN